jgi:putative hydrolase of the HAD superfamily
MPLAVYSRYYEPLYLLPNMAIRAVVFDIGDVLEITPRIGVTEKWEQKLLLEAGGMSKRLGDVWRAGSIGLISEAEVHQRIGEILGIDESLVNAFMDDIWTEYLGELNVELANYFGSLRPRYQTAIISNSFVGAREREQELYRFHELTDLIIYSHEVGLAKPDPRIYEIACEHLGIRLTEMIFLDDVEPIVIAARELGIHAIQFKDNAQAIADIETCLKEQSDDKSNR